MLRDLRSLEDLEIGATDGAVGHVKDFYIDTVAWAVHYLVVECGDIHAPRRVMISPRDVASPVGNERVLLSTLTRRQVRNSQEAGLSDLPRLQPPHPTRAGDATGSVFVPYGMPRDDTLSRLPYACATPSGRLETPDGPESDLRDYPHLQSADALAGFRVHASDGSIGYLSGLVVEDKTWVIQYLVVHTSNGWGGQDVILTPASVEAINWRKSVIHIDLCRASIKRATPYDPMQIRSTLL